MTNKKIFRLSMAAMVAMVILGLTTSFLTLINPSGTNTSKESTAPCTQMNHPPIKSEADFEPLSGKFFSSFSY